MYNDMLYNVGFEGIMLYILCAKAEIIEIKLFLDIIYKKKMYDNIE